MHLAQGYAPNTVVICTSHSDMHIGHKAMYLTQCYAPNTGLCTKACHTTLHQCNPNHSIMIGHIPNFTIGTTDPTAAQTAQVRAPRDIALMLNVSCHPMDTCIPARRGAQIWSQRVGHDMGGSKQGTNRSPIGMFFTQNRCLSFPE